MITGRGWGWIGGDVNIVECQPLSKQQAILKMNDTFLEAYARRPTTSGMPI